MPTINTENDPSVFVFTDMDGLTIDGIELACVIADSGINLNDDSLSTTAEELKIIGDAVRTVARPKGVADKFQNWQLAAAGTKALKAEYEAGKDTGPSQT